MNRRELLASLVALPEVARISVARPKPDDVIVVECDVFINAEQTERIKAQITSAFPGRQILVFDKGYRMKFASRGTNP